MGKSKPGRKHFLDIEWLFNHNWYSDNRRFVIKECVSCNFCTRKFVQRKILNRNSQISRIQLNNESKKISHIICTLNESK